MKGRSFHLWAAIAASGFVCCCLLIPSVRSDDVPKDEWKVPEYAGRKKNPIPTSDASIAAGKKAYLGNCLACHGAKGTGDGPAAAQLDRKPGDLSSKKVQSGDGELYWKVTQGRKPMPSYSKLLKDDQRWNVINYVRTLAAH